MHVDGKKIRLRLRAFLDKDSRVRTPPAPQLSSGAALHALHVVMKNIQLEKLSRINDSTFSRFREENALSAQLFGLPSAGPRTAIGLVERQLEWLLHIRVATIRSDHS